MRVVSSRSRSVYALTVVLIAYSMGPLIERPPSMDLEGLALAESIEQPVVVVDHVLWLGPDDRFPGRRDCLTKLWIRHDTSLPLRYRRALLAASAWRSASSNVFGRAATATDAIRRIASGRRCFLVE